LPQFKKRALRLKQSWNNGPQHGTVGQLFKNLILGFLEFHFNLEPKLEISLLGVNIYGQESGAITKRTSLSPNNHLGETEVPTLFGAILYGRTEMLHEPSGDRTQTEGALVAANRHPGQVGYSHSPPQEVRDEESSYEQIQARKVKARLRMLQPHRQRKTVLNPDISFCRVW
jgi:hypothetical protein